MIITRNKFLKLVGFFALTVFVTVAAGDIVHFKNGKKIEGTVEDLDDDTFLLKTSAGKITIRKSSVKNIERSALEKQEEDAVPSGNEQSSFLKNCPEKFKDLVGDFDSLQKGRENAIKKNKLKKYALYKILSLENTNKKLNVELTSLNKRIALINPDRNVKNYNSLIKKSNNISARIQINHSNLTQLNKKYEKIDSDINDYFDLLNESKEKINKKHEEVSKSLTPEEEEYFQTLCSELKEFESDFVRHEYKYDKKHKSTIVVSSLLNGKVRANLIVDTGASLVCMSEKIANKLGIDTDKSLFTMTVLLADGSQGKAMPLILKSVKVGDLEVQYVRAAVLNDVGGEDGLLGMSFLENFKVSIDSKEKTLILDEFSAGAN